MKKATALVPRAAKLLDRLYPNWHRKIKVTQFDIRHGCSCITGQLRIGPLSDEFNRLPNTVLKATGWAHRRELEGFGVWEPREITNPFQEAWLIEIRNRKAADRLA